MNGYAGSAGLSPNHSQKSKTRARDCGGASPVAMSMIDLAKLVGLPRAFGSGHRVASMALPISLNRSSRAALLPSIRDPFTTPISIGAPFPLSNLHNLDREIDSRSQLPQTGFIPSELPAVSARNRAASCSPSRRARLPFLLVFAFVVAPSPSFRPLASLVALEWA